MVYRVDADIHGARSLDPTGNQQKEEDNSGGTAVDPTGAPRTAVATAVEGITRLPRYPD